MLCWGKRLKQEHPQMWHEIASNPVIGVIEKNFHFVFSTSVCS